MGGVVIREALHEDWLREEVSTKLENFISLSCPHLGAVSPNNFIISSAVWLWQKITKSPSLSQLSLSDSNPPYLSSLAKTTGLEYFKHIVLVGSNQDGFVPFFSSTLDFVQAEILGGIYLEMLDNLLAPIQKSGRTKVLQFDIHFGEQSLKSWDDATGRTVHTAFLDNVTFIQMLLSFCQDFL